MSASEEPDATTPRHPDPTRTETLRDRWVSRFNAKWRDVRGALRDALVSNDRFSLSTRGAPGDRYRDDAARLANFREWVRSQMDVLVLAPLAMEAVRRGSHWTASWMHDAYEHGLRRADQLLRATNYDTPDTSPAAVITAERHQSTLRRVYTRIYQDLQDIVRETTKRIARTFDEQLDQESINRSELADLVTDDVDAEGQTRTEIMAVSTPVLLVNRAALTRYETADVDTVGAAIETDGGRNLPPSAPEDRDEDGRPPRSLTDQLRTTIEGPMTDDPRLAAEGVQGSDKEVTYVTAQDSHVCAECRLYEGRRWTVDEFRDGDGIIPIKDTHLRCRCLLIPS